MSELEQKLYQAMEHAAPQDLDRFCRLRAAEP